MYTKIKYFFEEIYKILKKLEEKKSTTAKITYWLLQTI
jgi:hypothetical protein